MALEISIGNNDDDVGLIARLAFPLLIKKEEAGEMRCAIAFLHICAVALDCDFNAC